MEQRFYLGKKLEKGKLGEKLLYKPSHLTTHAVVFGMTGSGKTGLCIDLLEEAALNGVPVIAVDPKGDVANLALVFDELSPENFLPWVSQEEASLKGMTKEEFAREMARKWKDGLREWGIDEGRLKAFREKVDVRIYTPGSTASTPVNIITGFETPPEDFNSDPELYLEKIKNSVSALLSVLGEETDPVKNPAHILISSIIEHFWRKGKGISLENLILAVQQPPIKKLGVFEIDTIFPPEKRLSLALSLNNLVASPNFRLWREGIPLQASVLYEKDGKTPINIFYIAHLSERERMFFVSLLFNEVLAFVRTLPGSSQLKYLLYMDEIYGYFPPYPYNPPSKNPLMLLLKQARAFGLGVVLVTQNPKDIDYKGLTNMGTWFIGRLQAEGDRERVLEGLEGATTSQGVEIDSKILRDIVTGLRSRVFLLHDAREGKPLVFKTRWAMSYLKGPLTRAQIKKIGGKPKQAEKAPPRVKVQESQLLSYPPAPPAGMEAFYELTDSENPVYYPWFMAEAEVLFDEPKLGFYHRKKLHLISDFQGKTVDEAREETSPQPPSGARFTPFPTQISLKLLNGIKKKMKEFLLSREKITLFRNPSLKLISSPEESKEDFLLRCQEAARGRARREIERMKGKYMRKLETLERKLRRARNQLDTLEARYKGRAAEEALSVGEILLGLALGRKPTTVLTRTARRRRMTAETKHRMEDAREKIEEIKEEMEELRSQMEDQEENIREKYESMATDINPLPIGLEKNDIILSSLSLLWRENPSQNHSTP